MVDKPIGRSDLLGKVVDAHSHAGVQIQALAQVGFPYCSSLEDLYYRQIANGVDYGVVFPISPALYFDLTTYAETGKLVPAAHPLSRAPYERENRLLLTELYVFCPEFRQRFLPFVSVDPGRCVAEQLTILQELEREFPIYGVKIVPVLCQSKVTALLEGGEAFLEFFVERNWPVLFHVDTSPDEEYSQASDTFRVIERHPELRYCLAHCIGLHREYLEQADVLPNVWVDTAALKIQVQLARENSPLMAVPPDRFDCDLSSHSAVMQALVERFPTTIVWGSDAPYHSYITRRLQAEGVYADFRLKGTYEDEKAAWDALAPQQRTQLNGNVIRFLFGEEL